MLAEPDEKLSTCKNIFGEIILLDNYINEKQRINRIVEGKKSAMSKAGIFCSSIIFSTYIKIYTCFHQVKLAIAQCKKHRM